MISMNDTIKNLDRVFILVSLLEGWEGSTDYLILCLLEIFLSQNTYILYFIHCFKVYLLSSTTVDDGIIFVSAAPCQQEPATVVGDRVSLTTVRIRITQKYISRLLQYEVPCTYYSFYNLRTTHFDEYTTIAVRYMPISSTQKLVRLHAQHLSVFQTLRMQLRSTLYQ